MIVRNRVCGTFHQGFERESPDLGRWANGACSPEEGNDLPYLE
jgi:hypothetical protein